LVSLKRGAIMRGLILVLTGFLTLMGGCSKLQDPFLDNPLSSELTCTGNPYHSGGVLGTFTVNKNGLGLEMIKLDSMANFQMGSPASEDGLGVLPAERPVHAVNLSSFSIAKYEITISQYAIFLNAGGNDVHYRGSPYMGNPAYCGIISNGPGNYSVYPGKESFPVVYVSWYDCKAFCDWLTGITGKKWRLPTEAEWEYAAVGNQGHRIWPWGDTFHTNYCNGYYTSYWSGGIFYSTKPVGSYPDGKSLFGLYDMAGNVYEWCSDWLGDYPSFAVNDPAGPSSGYSKIFRGGSFCTTYEGQRCTRRSCLNPTGWGYPLGFRIVQPE
jgi:formylglycine-generating enzyme required for sulfatase activity